MNSTELGRSRSREIRVRARSIDSYVEETGVQPDVVKIDTEGAELDVLRGMAKLLRSKRPLLTIEVGDVGLRATAGESRWVVEHMLAHDYQAFELTGDRFKEHTLKDSYPHGNLLFRPKS